MSALAARSRFDLVSIRLISWIARQSRKAWIHEITLNRTKNLTKKFPE